MDGQITIDSNQPEQTAVMLVQRLEQELRKLKPKSIAADTRQVTVRGGPFRLVHNWNLLSAISAARIELTPQPRGVSITYNVQLKQLLWGCVIFSGVLLIVAMLSRSLAFLISSQIAVWGWLFGASYLTTRFRFRRFLERVAKTEVPC